MWVRPLALLLAVALTACARPLAAETGAPTMSATALTADAPAPVDAKLQAVDAWLTAETAADRFSGAVVVMQGDRVLLRKGYGLADRSWGAAFTPDTKVAIASLTKQFTSAAILKLQDEGKLSVSDPVCRFIKPCPKEWEAITLHHLMTHKSGISEVLTRPDYAVVARRRATPKEQTEASAKFGLDFPPGTRFKYSNGGYQLLGDVIERVSGQPYSTYMRTALFEPLGLADTGYEDDRTVLTKLAQGYDVEGGTVVRPFWRDPSVIFSAGGLYSTADDLAKWTRALHHGRVVSPASYAQMTGRAGAVTDYGFRDRTRYDLVYAYGLQRAPAGMMTEPGFTDEQIFHTGSWNGFRNLVTYVPSTDLVVVVVCNRIEQSGTVLMASQRAVAAALSRPEPTGFAPREQAAG